VAEHFIENRRLLHHASLGCEVAEKDGKPSMPMVGGLLRADHVRIEGAHLLDIFRDGFTRCGEAIPVDQSGSGELADNRRNAAGPVELFENVSSPGLMEQRWGVASLILLMRLRSNGTFASFAMAVR
jgi:hypothetical protein